MRIDAYTQVQQLYANSMQKTDKKGRGQDVASQGGFLDAVSLSSTSKDAQLASQAVASAPDIRMDKVAEVKSAVENGTYEVDADAFAEKLLDKYSGLF